MFYKKKVISQPDSNERNHCARLYHPPNPKKNEGPIGQEPRTHIRSTNRRTSNELLRSKPKKAGPALPVLKARMLKLTENQSQKNWCIRVSVRLCGGVGVMLITIECRGIYQSKVK